MLETGEPLLIQRDDPNADGKEVALMKEQGVLTNLMFPLKTKDRVLGIVEIYEDVKAREFTKRELRLAETLAFRAAVALENSRLYEDARNENAKRERANSRSARIWNRSALSDFIKNH